mmetsp:Transcript_3268/g.3620  ORF Transcript_3268/g.3620 Transcript_3268/m.3620 type:complete len:93 (+) Transcript_3268:230-508(+)
MSCVRVCTVPVANECMGISHKRNNLHTHTHSLSFFKSNSIDVPAPPPFYTPKTIHPHYSPSISPPSPSLQRTTPCKHWSTNAHRVTPPPPPP